MGNFTHECLCRILKCYTGLIGGTIGEEGRKARKVSSSL